MFRDMKRATVAVGVAVLFAGGAAQAASITNGDFEALDPGAPVFANWSNNAGVTLASQSIGGANGARIALNTGNSGNALNQTASDPGGVLSSYAVSFDFATSNPGSATARSMQLNLRTTVNVDSGNVNLRVVGGTEPGKGTVQVFQGTWMTAVANAVNFSTSETGAGFALNHAEIAGDYSGTTPVYTITVNGIGSGSLSFFQTSAPAQGTTLKQVSFQSGNVASGAWAVVDNITLVPEPSALGTLGFAGLLLQRRRRRQN